MSEDVLTVKLHNVRLSYPHLFKAKAFEDGGNLRYSATFLISKTTPEGKRNFELLKAALDEARLQKWGKNSPKLSPDKKCLRDGDDSEVIEDKDAAAYNGH